MLAEPGRLTAGIKSGAEQVGLAFTVFLVGKHLAYGDLEGLGFDALNLHVLPKVGEKMTMAVTEAADKLGSAAVRGSAPILGRAVGERMFVYAY